MGFEINSNLKDINFKNNSFRKLADNFSSLFGQKFCVISIILVALTLSSKKLNFVFEN